MLSKNIYFENFKIKKKNKNLIPLYNKLIKRKKIKDDLINSFTNSYSYSFEKNQLKKYKKFNSYSIYGMGGSSLGIQAIYDFFKKDIKKKFFFFNNLQTQTNIIKNKKKNLNIIISKSGNTLETIVNENIFSGNNKLFIVEKKNNYLQNLALKLKSEIIEHKNFIGGRYSILSEVGMLPSELMGLNSNKFKKFDNLILNKNFVKNLLTNVNALYNLVKKEKLTLSS